MKQMTKKPAKSEKAPGKEVKIKVKIKSTTPEGAKNALKKIVK